MPMKVVALTGGFLTGKSSCLKLFVQNGAQVYDTDNIYHELLVSSRELQTALKNELGSEKDIDRQMIKTSLAQGKLDMERLSEITHPFIIQRLKDLVEEFKGKDGQGLLVFEVPLLYECKLESLFDTVIVVAASKSVLHDRAIERGYSQEQADMIMDAQLDLSLKVSKADIVIDNSNSLDELEIEIEKIYKFLYSMQKEA